MSTQTETVLSNGTSQTSTYVPTHPDAIRVEFQDGDYNSYAVASRVSAHSLRQPFQKGDIIATFEHATPSSVVRYSTVQTGDDAHLELNSEYVCQLTPSLLYCNHSCDPSVEFHVDETDLRKGYARAARDIRQGEALTFCMSRTNPSLPLDGMAHGPAVHVSLQRQGAWGPSPSNASARSPAPKTSATIS